MLKDKHVLLIDGMALLFRSFFSTSVTGQFMINSSGIPTNGVQGFLKHTLLSIKEFNPTHVAVCWDMGSVTFRNDMFDGYKSNRDAPPVELLPQFDFAKESAEALGLSNIGVVGYEADDCIGTLAKGYSKEVKVSILSGDHDLLQLVDEHINVHILKKGYGQYSTYSKKAFIEEKGITPSQFIDVKAFMGDTSDGYPGVRGIGEKTATKLIQEYGSIEGVLNNLHLLTNAQQRKINENLDMLHLSRQLAKIYCEVPFPDVWTPSIWNGVSSLFHDYVLKHELRTVDRFLSTNFQINKENLA
ncbi:5'-3' exonuclease [Bacillus coahuilensis]|nr:5'-3' exonuclease [Bacillus coahuilensis]